MSVCSACRINSVVTIYTYGICDTCARFITSIKTPAVIATRKYLLSHSHVVIDIGYAPDIIRFRVNEYAGTGEDCVKARDYLCQQIGIKMDTARRMSGYMVRMSYTALNNKDAKYMYSPGDALKSGEYICVIKIMVTRRAFKLSYLVMEDCTKRMINNEDLDIDKLDVFSKEALLKFKAAYVNSFPVA